MGYMFNMLLGFLSKFSVVTMLISTSRNIFFLYIKATFNIF